jgi:hypothetical protein
MSSIIRADRRGESNYNWASAHYYFSFAEYKNPVYTQFGNLRAVNEICLRKQEQFANSVLPPQYTLIQAVQSGVLSTCHDATENAVQQISAG